jgi:hypothetical protein
MPASDRDLEGRPITNPETAPLPGHYTVCGYYRVEPAKVRADLSSTVPIATSSSVLASGDVIVMYPSRPAVLLGTVSALASKP